MSSNLPIMALVEMGVYGRTRRSPLASSGVPRSSRHAQVLRPSGLVGSGHSNVKILEFFVMDRFSSIFAGFHSVSNWHSPGGMYAAIGCIASAEKNHALFGMFARFGGSRAVNETRAGAAVAASSSSSSITVAWPTWAPEFHGQHEQYDPSSFVLIAEDMDFNPNPDTLLRGLTGRVFLILAAFLSTNLRYR